GQERETHAGRFAEVLPQNEVGEERALRDGGTAQPGRFLTVAGDAPASFGIYEGQKRDSANPIADARERGSVDRVDADIGCCDRPSCDSGQAAAVDEVGKKFPPAAPTR